VLDRIGQRLPQPLTLFLITLTAVSVSLAFVKGLQDPDYFWHLQTGELIARSGLPSHDPFSFTYGGPWTLHEWLGELLIFRMVDGMGPVATLAAFALLPPATLSILAVALRRDGVPIRAVVAATLICGTVLIPYVTVRPQLFSWLLLAVVLAILGRLRPTSARVLVALPPLFILWANLHGLYVIGLGVVGVYVLFTLLGATDLSTRKGRVVLAGVASLLASAVTPAGPAGLLYPLRYVDSGDWGLAHIPEWQSPNFHDLVQVPLLVLILGLAVVGQRGPAWVRTIAYLGVIGALLANRNVPVAAVACLPALAIGLGRWLPDRPSARNADGSRRVVETLAAALLVVGALAAIPATPGFAEVLLGRYPAAGVEQLHQLQPASRVVAEYGWGGYVIQSLYEDGARVFVDGRNDMYPEAILRDYSTIRAADPGWQAIVDRYAADAMLFPPEAPIVKGIAQAAGWCEAYRDARQVLLLRSCAGAARNSGRAIARTTGMSL
jgi:hypothetical protein